MDITYLRRALGSSTGLSQGQIGHVVHHLMRRDIVPNNGRGRPAAKVQLEHCAASLVALAISGTPYEATGRVIEWLSMPEIPTGPTTFGDHLASVCGAYPNDVREIRICRSWPHAVVVRANGIVAEFGYGSPEAACAAGYAAASVRSEFVIPGSALDALASGFQSGPGVGPRDSDASRAQRR